MMFRSGVVLVTCRKKKKKNVVFKTREYRKHRLFLPGLEWVDHLRYIVVGQPLLVIYTR